MGFVSFQWNPIHLIGSSFAAMAIAHFEIGAPTSHLAEKCGDAA